MHSFILYLFGGAITVISFICRCNLDEKRTESNLSFLSKYDLSMLFIHHTSGVSTYIPCMYCYVSNKRGGSNKRVCWNFSSHLISRYLITAGRVDICVGKKTGRLETFLKINKRGGLNNSGEGGKFPEN